MLTNVKEDGEASVETPVLQLVMNLSIKEMVRQVSVHCQERGNLLQRMFEHLFA